LYFLAFLLALGLRLLRLGATPLTEAEANWAMHALELARGGQPLIGAQPAYVLLTGLLFAVLPATAFLARLLPALAGSLLVLLPLQLHPWLGDSTLLRRAGLVLAFGLALDPGLVALSRQAGSLIPALAFGLLALPFFARRWLILAGVTAGLALLSGPALLHGVLILALSWGAYRLLGRVLKRFELTGAVGSIRLVDLSPLEPGALRNGLLALGGTLLFAGLFFFRIPQGLAGLADMLPEYLQGWISPSGIPALRLPAALLVYHALVLLLALLAAGRGWWRLLTGGRAERLAVALSLWALIAMLVVMLYPARQVGDLVWALLPLWGLAALELPHHLPVNEDRSTRLVAAGLTALLFVLTVIVWVNFLNISRYQANYSLYWIIIGGAVLLGAISSALVAAGWSIVSARLGLIWAVCITLGLSMFSGMWGAAQLRPNSAQELWTELPAAGQADLLVDTLTDLSRWSTGHDHEIEIVMLVDSAALRWALREFPNLRTADDLAATDAPPIVFTAQSGQTPTLAQSYRGQDLVWHQVPGWQTALPIDLGVWLTFRQAPLASEQIILWARADLFPGGLEALSGAEEPAVP